MYDVRDQVRQVNCTSPNCIMHTAINQSCGYSVGRAESHGYMYDVRDQVRLCFSNNVITRVIAERAMDNHADLEITKPLYQHFLWRAVSHVDGMGKYKLTRILA